MIIFHFLLINTLGDLSDAGPPGKATFLDEVKSCKSSIQNNQLCELLALYPSS